MSEVIIETRSIKDMTYEELCHIANIATGGYFTSEFSRDHKEVEVGGYGWRRRVEWIQSTEHYDEFHFFVITGEYKGNSWSWHCKSTFELEGQTEFLGNVIDGSGEPNWLIGNLINTVNPMKIVDYCREIGLDIENKHRRL